MKLDIDTLIIGTGYAGLLCQKRLDAIGIKNFIIDKGDSIKFADKDYIVIFRDQNSYCHKEPINMIINRYTSGTKSFDEEFSQKLYRKDTNLTLGENQDTEIVFQMNNNKLLTDSRVYGNITAQSIDLDAHILRGKVTHIGKNVEIHYNKLISTVPIYEFAKLIGHDLYEEFNLFIQFYPIGIIKKYNQKKLPCIRMDYFSDPLIPFYRKHHYGNTTFYEYCINRPFDVNFTRVIGPGKFSNILPILMKGFYYYLEQHNVYLAGRFATWDSDFRLDHILSPNLDKDSCTYLQGAFSK